MSEENKLPDKSAAKEPRAKKPPEYRRFEDVLRKVIKAPPMIKGKKVMGDSQRETRS